MTGLLVVTVLSRAPNFFKPTVFAQAPVSVTLDFSAPGKVVSPTLYGLMTEEINYSYDGGLYGELVRNRAFLDNPRQPLHWSAVGNQASIKLDATGPSPARPVSLQVQGGVANDGYWGIPIRPVQGQSMQALNLTTERLCMLAANSKASKTRGRISPHISKPNPTSALPKMSVWC